MIEILGITRHQQSVLKMVNEGLDHEEIAGITGVSEIRVIAEEMKAKASLSKRWGKTEAEVSRVIKSMLAIILCLIPMFDFSHAQDIVRTAKVRSVRVARRKDIDLNTLDI